MAPIQVVVLFLLLLSLPSRQMVAFLSLFPVATGTVMTGVVVSSNCPKTSMAPPLTSLLLKQQQQQQQQQVIHHYFGDLHGLKHIYVSGVLNLEVKYAIYLA